MAPKEHFSFFIFPDDQESVRWMECGGIAKIKVVNSDDQSSGSQISNPSHALGRTPLPGHNQDEHSSRQQPQQQQKQQQGQKCRQKQQDDHAQYQDQVSGSLSRRRAETPRSRSRLSSRQSLQPSAPSCLPAPVLTSRRRVATCPSPTRTLRAMTSSSTRTPNSAWPFVCAPARSRSWRPPRNL